MVAVWFFTHEGSEPAEVPLAGDGEPSWASIPAAALIWTDGMATWLPASSFIPSHDSWSNEENNAALPPPDVTETEGTVDDNDDDINNNYLAPKYLSSKSVPALGKFEGGKLIEVEEECNTFLTATRSESVLEQLAQDILRETDIKYDFLFYDSKSARIHFKSTRISCIFIAISVFVIQNLILF